MRSRRHDIHRTPWLFRIWFGFILTAILCVWGAVGFSFYTAATQPELIGQHTGRMLRGVLQGFDY